VPVPAGVDESNVGDPQVYANHVQEGKVEEHVRQHHFPRGQVGFVAKAVEVGELKVQFESGMQMRALRDVRLQTDLVNQKVQALLSGLEVVKDQWRGWRPTRFRQHVEEDAVRRGVQQHFSVSVAAEFEFVVVLRQHIVVVQFTAADGSSGSVQKGLQGATRFVGFQIGHEMVKGALVFKALEQKADAVNVVVNAVVAKLVGERTAAPAFVGMHKGVVVVHSKAQSKVVHRQIVVTRLCKSKGEAQGADHGAVVVFGEVAVFVGLRHLRRHGQPQRRHQPNEVMLNWPWP